MLDFIGIGGIAYDMVINVNQFPCDDGKVIATGSTRTAGGFISNSVCAAVELGLSVGYVGWVGADDGGILLRDDFVQRGVDVSVLETIADAETPYTVILVTPNGERSIIVPPNPLHDWELSAAQLKTLESAKVIYTYPRNLAWCEQIANVAHANGNLFALDIEAYVSLPLDALEKIIALTDVLFIAPSIRESMAVANVAAVKTRGWVIETHGADGSTGYDAANNQTYHVPARKVEVMDTTGAGDCFHAAVIAAKLWGYDLRGAMELATAAASIAVGYAGGRGGFPTRAQVAAVLDGA